MAAPASLVHIIREDVVDGFENIVKYKTKYFVINAGLVGFPEKQFKRSVKIEFVKVVKYEALTS